MPPGTQVNPGDEFRYVWHCHVLEHEDNEMMRPYKIVG
ncbi:MAG: multicopper oxidase domain-containing protein [Candidatus Sulfotelmatobacter sp.]